MYLYSLLKMQEHLFYISTVAELTNIFYFLSIILKIDLPYGFNQGMDLFNAIYGAYIFFVIFFTVGKFKKGACVILTLSILKSLIWGNIPVISIIDSLICIGILIYYHRFLYAAIKQVEDTINKDLS